MNRISMEAIMAIAFSVSPQYPFGRARTHGRYEGTNRNKWQGIRHGGSTWTPKKHRNRKGRDPEGRSGYFS